MNQKSENKDYLFKKGSKFASECGKKGGARHREEAVKQKEKETKAKKKIEEEEKKKTAELLKEIIDVGMIGNIDLLDAKDIQSYDELSKKDVNIPLRFALLVAQINNALYGDLNSYKYLMDLLKEGPENVTKIELLNQHENLQAMLEQLSKNPIDLDSDPCEGDD